MTKNAEKQAPKLVEVTTVKAVTHKGEDYEAGAKLEVTEGQKRIFEDMGIIEKEGE